MVFRCKILSKQWLGLCCVLPSRAASVRSSCECGEGLDWLDDRMEEEEVEEVEEEVEEVVVEVEEVEEVTLYVAVEEEEVVEKTEVTKH